MLSTPARRSDLLVRVTALLGFAILVTYLATRAVGAIQPSEQSLTGSLLLAAANLEAVVLLAFAAQAASRTAWRACFAWGALAAGQACRLVGELSVAWPSLAAGRTMPSVVMLVGYTAYYPLIIAGLLYLPLLALTRRERINLLVDLGLLAIGLAIILWSVWFGAAMTLGAAPIERLFRAVASPAGDSAILYAVVWLLLRQFENRARPLLLLAVAASLLLLTDLVVSFQALLGHSSSGSWTQAGWLLSYGLLAIAGGYQAVGRTASSVPMSRLVGRQLAARLQSALSYLPYGMVGLAFAVLLLDRAQLWSVNATLIGWSVAGVIVLVVLRQVLASRETERLLGAERRWRESDGILLELSRRLLAAQDEASAGAQATEIAALALHANQALLALPDAEGRLEMRAAWGRRDEPDLSIYFEPGNRSQIGMTVARGLPVRVDGTNPATDFEVGAVLAQHHSAASLSVPMLVDGRLAGALLVSSREPRQFDEVEIGLLVLIANQTAAAYDKLRLFGVSRRQLDELKVLHAIANAGAEAGDEDAYLERVTAIIGESLFPNHFGVMLLEPDTGILRSHRSYRGDNGFSTPIGHGVTGHVALTAQPSRVADVSLDPRYLAAEHGMQSELCVPLISGEQVLGVINIESTRRAAFEAADERLLVTIARQVATALAKLRLFERLIQAEHQRAGELEAVRQASLGLTASLDLQAVLKAILNSTMRMVTGARQAFIFLYHTEGGGRLTFAAERTRDGAGEGYWEPRPEGLTYKVARLGEVVIVPICARRRYSGTALENGVGRSSGCRSRLGRVWWA
jgi:GAF domain-containing protein